MFQLLGVVKCIKKESKNSENRNSTAKAIVDDLITHKDTCLYLDSMYYNNSLNIPACVRTFKNHLQIDTWSFYTLHLLMDVNDIQSLVDN